MYAATEKGTQMWAVVYYSVCLHKNDHEKARDLNCNAEALPH
jgi:hypothetical protein